MGLYRRQFVYSTAGMGYSWKLSEGVCPTLAIPDTKLKCDVIFSFLVSVSRVVDWLKIYPNPDSGCKKHKTLPYYMEKESKPSFKSHRRSKSTHYLREYLMGVHLGICYST